MIIILKIIIFGGFLGSGKTTTIINIGKYYSINKNKKVGIIVNEIGDIGIDGDIINQYGFDSKEITSGCICCSLKVSLRNTIVTMIENYNPDILIIEPTGVAFPNQIKNEIELMTIGVEYQIYPLVVIVDSSRFKEIVKGLNKFFLNQLKDAEIILLNKIDLLDNYKIKLIRESLHQMNNNAKLITYSNKLENKINEFLDILEKNDIKKENILKSNIQMYDNNFSIKNSIVDSKIFTYSLMYFLIFDKSKIFSDEIIKELLFNIIKEIKKILLSECNKLYFIGHIKLYINNSKNTYKLSLLSSSQDPIYEIINYKNENCTFKILIAIQNIVFKDKLKLNNEINKHINIIFDNYSVKYYKKNM